MWQRDAVSRTHGLGLITQAFDIFEMEAKSKTPDDPQRNGIPEGGTEIWEKSMPDYSKYRYSEYGGYILIPKSRDIFQSWGDGFSWVMCLRVLSASVCLGLLSLSLAGWTRS
jgi:hypothetical protein